ncbi:hypothetical protein POVWA2_027320 [Plasmodium ovale wallikeri]|uniref:Uncharacterized protein n=1 Tax=Plasmodium ovale wallikeri TaxID=864142 RepID=A0A1A8YUV3_PLAOA|nr:hypothetical protein POVWA1_027160 [Plasmodium ovale wallikeri]SBT35910.1 hypothetical protein POVWA2_027320 [Plasmodium ovale wallikeri]
MLFEQLRLLISPSKVLFICSPLLPNKNASDSNDAKKMCEESASFPLSIRTFLCLSLKQCHDLVALRLCCFLL